MKNQMNTNLVIRSGLTLALALATWLPSAANAADKPMKPMKGGNHQMTTGTNMMQRCQAMMEQKQKMMAAMKVQDAELAAQVAKMNNAPESKKVELMAALVTRMVEQRTARHARMEGMQAGMMQHMMQHMQMGQESMAECPMMAGMKGRDDKAADPHKEHQAEKN